MSYSDRPSVWYKPVTQKDYEKIGQIGEVTIQLRILPGFANGVAHEAVFEKNTATSNYPNSKKWVLPVCVLDDPLHPECNGRVCVMDISKTLKNRIQGVDTPMNYYDINAGFNFNLVVSLQQSNDGNSYFPNYSKSAYSPAPCPIDGNYVFTQMTDLRIVDFAGWARQLNDAISKKAQGASSGYAAPQQYGQVNPAAVTPSAPYTPGVVPMTPAAPAPAPAAPINPGVMPGVMPGAIAPAAQAAPVAQAPTPFVVPVQTPPAPSNNVPWTPAAAAPPAPNAPSAPQPQTSGNDFDNVFGTPDDVAF